MCIISKYLNNELNVTDAAGLDATVAAALLVGSGGGSSSSDSSSDSDSDSDSR